MSCAIQLFVLVAKLATGNNSSSLWPNHNIRMHTNHQKRSFRLIPAIMAAFSTEDSVFRKISAELSLHLPPSCLADVDAGIHGYLNGTFLLRYKEIFEGIPICYNKVEYSKTDCELLYENPFIHIQALVEFVVFVPHRGATLRCRVNKQSEDHVGGLVFGTFNVSIGARELNAYGYMWNEEISAWCWQDEVIQNDNELEFLVDKMKHGHEVLVIYGRFPSE